MSSGFETMEQAVRSFFRWQHPNKDENVPFSTMLIDLFQKADWQNKAILAEAYPLLSVAYIEWESAGNYGEDLFDRYGIKRGTEP